MVTNGLIEFENNKFKSKNSKKSPIQEKLKDVNVLLAGPGNTAILIDYVQKSPWTLKVIEG
jgi:hypothetical protein